MSPLVLLPGMMCDERLFAPQVAAFGLIREVIVADISEHNTVHGLASRVLAAAPERFDLAGLSMGGIVAMEIVRQVPQRVSRLALLDTNPCAETPIMRDRRSPQMEKVKAGRLCAVMREEMKPNYLAHGDGRQAILDLCMVMAETLGADVFIRQSQALRDRPDQQYSLQAVSVPTLILCGREDRACPVERHELMHRLIPHSTLTIIEGAGHLPTLEKPKATNTALARWLKD